MFHKSYFYLVGLSVMGICSGELQATLSKSRLPVPASSSSGIYDGKDSIYIIGGHDGAGAINNIYRYQISSDTITQIPVFEFPARYDGGISMDTSGNIFYYGGLDPYNPSNLVCKLKPTGDNALVMEYSYLNTPFAYSPVVTSSARPNLAYRINGWDYAPQYIHCFNMTDMTFCGNTEIPRGQQFRLSSAFVQDNKAFLFARDQGNEIMIVDLATLTTQIVPTNLPRFMLEPRAVSDGRFGYLIGGFEHSEATPTDSVIKFDPTTFTHEFIHVENFPFAPDVFHAPTTVYVEKLNRFYIFGGSSYYARKTHDEIWYIDLPTPVPTEPTDPISGCEGKHNGMYQNPSDCSGFFACRNGTAESFVCPEPLLFNIVTRACDYSENVNCDISCAGKPNGMYPHTECDLFVSCYDETIELHRCPHPLLFNNDKGGCWFPQETNC